MSTTFKTDKKTAILGTLKNNPFFRLFEKTVERVKTNVREERERHVIIKSLLWSIKNSGKEDAGRAIEKAIKNRAWVVKVWRKAMRNPELRDDRKYVLKKIADGMRDTDRFGVFCNFVQICRFIGAFEGREFVRLAVENNEPYAQRLVEDVKKHLPPLVEEKSIGRKSLKEKYGEF